MPRTFRERYKPWRAGGVSLGYVRNGIYWIARTVHGRRFRISTGCRTPDAALAEYQRFEKDPARFVPRSSRGTDWDGAVKDYLRFSASVRLNGASHVDHQTYRLANWGSFTRAGSRVFGSLESFTRADILAFIEALTTGAITGRPVGPPSVNRHLSDLKALMKWAREGKLTANTADQEVPMVREERGVRAHEEIERKRWEAVRPHLLPKWQHALDVLLGTGLRASELARLAPDDILHRTIRVPRAKGRRSREVPASQRTTKAAEALLAEGGFPDDEGSQFNHRVRVAAARAGAEPFTAHDCRHTFGTVCLRNGAALRDVQAWMGHASIRTTEKYLHAAQRGRRGSFAPV